MHRSLEMQAKHTTFNNDMTVKEVLAKNEALRLQILQTEYTKIKDERTSVQMAITSTTTHPNFRSAVWLILVDGISENVRQIEERMMAEEINMAIEEKFKPKYGASSEPFINQTDTPNSRGRGSVRGRGRC